MRRTKIVATIGPSSWDAATLRGLIDAGMDVARLNFSHGNPEMHLETLGRIRKAAREAGREVAVLQDLPGPKMRSGAGETIELALDAEVEVVPGRDLTLPGSIGTEYKALGRELGPGSRILLSDGTLELRVTESSPELLRARVVREGILKPRQGMNLPGARLSASSPTDEDIRFLEWGIKAGVDYVALSFVQSAEDVIRARAAAGAAGRDMRFIAKIERPEAMADFKAVLAASDGVMVARGDMGVELPPEELPALQRRIIQMANAANKPVITATQMLESMISHSRPTRAEVSDVAHAVWEGTDAVMLSGETASGRYPVESCAMMARVCVEAELDEGSMLANATACRDAEHSADEDVVGIAAELLSRRLESPAIAVFTMSGETARYVSLARPKCVILGLSPDERARRRMALYRGVLPMAAALIEEPGDVAMEACRRMIDLGLGREDSLTVLVYGEPLGSGARANTLRVARLADCATRP